MALKFSSVQEIPLKKPPLAEVICQVKFSPILRIATEMPIDFQEAVRSQFPGLEIEQGVLFQLPTSGRIEKPIVDSTPKTYRFSRADQGSNLVLGTDFIAISTRNYTHWDNFLQEFTLAEEALRNVYNPGYVTRIGLRFINRFTRKNTGLKTTGEIFKLFRDDLTCILHTDAWDEPKEMLSQMVLADDGANLTLRSGFGREQKEPFFLLDIDYFEEKQLPSINLRNKLNRYHARIYSAFRWCLKQESLERFQPIESERK